MQLCYPSKPLRVAANGAAEVTTSGRSEGLDRTRCHRCRVPTALANQSTCRAAVNVHLDAADRAAPRRRRSVLVINAMKPRRQVLATCVGGRVRHEDQYGSQPLRRAARRWDVALDPGRNGDVRQTALAAETDCRTVALPLQIVGYPIDVGDDSDTGLSRTWLV